MSRYCGIPIPELEETTGRGGGLGRETGEEVAFDSSVPALLELLGTGAAGPILMALGPRPLRTRALTERIPQYAPRTVYRHVGRLAEQGLVIRREEGGVPSVVSYSLSERRGRELFRLLDSFAASALSRGPDGQIDEGSWTSLALLGEMWGAGWIAELGTAPRSPTELSELTPGMSFHQVNRRVHLLRSLGLLCEVSHSGRGKRYKLAPTVRREMALVAGIGRWRERHGLAGKQRGLTVAELQTVLRATLPLLKMPQHCEAQIKLGIAGAADGNGGKGSGILLVRCGRDGALRVSGNSDAPAAAWAAATVDIWLAALVDGNRGRMRVGGNLKLVDACLGGLHRVLWAAPNSS